jgi:hypothetical protein
MRTLSSFAALALAAATLGACGGTDANLEQRSRAALPTTDTVAVTNPKATSQSFAGGSSALIQDSKVGDNSQWFLTTLNMATSVNGAVVWTLSLIKAVTDLPPTTCTSDTCTWGPGADANGIWEVVVTYDAATDTYRYKLNGEAKVGGDGQFHTLVQGKAKPSGLPHRGTGSFEVDFDAGHLVNASSTDQGKLDVTYSNALPGQAHIDAQFLGVKDGDHQGQSLNAAYSFDETGSLQVAFRSLTSQDTVAMHSRWKATGQGRADVNVLYHTSAGGSYTAALSECWAAPVFVVTYFTSTAPAALGPDSGSAANCAFTDQSLATLTAP